MQIIYSLKLCLIGLYAALVNYISGLGCCVLTMLLRLRTYDCGKISFRNCQGLFLVYC